MKYFSPALWWALLVLLMDRLDASSYAPTSSQAAYVPGPRSGALPAARGKAEEEEPIAHKAARLLVSVESTLSIGAKQSSKDVHPGGITSQPTPGTYQKYSHRHHEEYHDISKTDPPALKIFNPSIGELKVYRPAVFNSLRRHAGVNDELYLQCLKTENLNCLNSDSKSGQAFWKSADDSIVLKTLKHYEVLNLRKVLDNYAAHALTDYSGIASVLGLYRVKMKTKLWGLVPVHTHKYFIACKNVYPRNSWHIVQKYDLKGSTVGRRAGGGSTVMKDLNLLEGNTKLQLGPARPVVLHALQRDVNFMKVHNFMDYSLLIAVEKNPTSHIKRFLDRFTTPKSVSAADAGKIVVLGGDGLIYHIGIIDFLQKYSFRKVLETFIKGLLHDARKISAVPAADYAKRMYAFICHVTQ